MVLVMPSGAPQDRAAVLRSRGPDLGSDSMRYLGHLAWGTETLPLMPNPSALEVAQRGLSMTRPLQPAWLVQIG